VPYSGGRRPKYIYLIYLARVNAERESTTDIIIILRGK
jgi:hypothetical protein